VCRLQRLPLPAPRDLSPSVCDYLRRNSCLKGDPRRGDGRRSPRDAAADAPSSCQGLFLEERVPIVSPLLDSRFSDFSAFRNGNESAPSSAFLSSPPSSDSHRDRPLPRPPRGGKSHHERELRARGSRFSAMTVASLRRAARLSAQFDSRQTPARRRERGNASSGSIATFVTRASLIAN